MALSVRTLPLVYSLMGSMMESRSQAVMIPQAVPYAQFLDHHAPIDCQTEVGVQQSLQADWVACSVQGLLLRPIVRSQRVESR